MEWWSQKNGYLKSLPLIVAWGGMFTNIPVVQADLLVVDFPKTQNGSQSGKSYPDSRFGFSPAQVGEDFKDGFTANQVKQESEWEGSLASTGNRSPAGLVFKGESRSPSRERPVVAPIPANVVSQSQAEPELSSVDVNVVATRKRGLQEVALIAGDLGYFPKVVFVTQDVPVRLYVTGASKNSLCLMMDSFQVRRQIKSEKVEEISFTPRMPGKYRFYCPLNGMEGSLVVREMGTVDQDPSRAVASE